MADEFYDLRCALLLGNYALAINEGTGRGSRKLDETQQWERDFIVLRAHVALRQYDVVSQDLAKRASNDNIRATQFLVQYLKAAETQSNESITAALEGLHTIISNVKTDAEWQTKHAVAVSAATVYLRERQFSVALPFLNTVITALSSATNPHTTAILELRSFVVDGLLRLHRVDYAEKEIQEMSKIDDDSLFTTLSTIAVYMASGHTKPDRLREALQLVEDIRDKNGASVLLLNIMATIHMLQGKYDVAEKTLLDALEKRNTDVDTLASLCITSLHLKKSPELVSRYLSQLKTASPHHPWVQQYIAIEQKVTSIKS